MEFRIDDKVMRQGEHGIFGPYTIKSIGSLKINATLYDEKTRRTISVPMHELIKVKQNPKDKEYVFGSNDRLSLIDDGSNVLRWLLDGEETGDIVHPDTLANLLNFGIVKEKQLAIEDFAVAWHRASPKWFLKTYPDIAKELYEKHKHNRLANT